ncbi:MAG: hypothetical protein Q9174_003388 [Haloplaca sp. 1 TL-2023]
MPWHCQQWTTQQLLDAPDEVARKDRVAIWQENTKAHFNFVAVAVSHPFNAFLATIDFYNTTVPATLVAGVVTGSITWSQVETAHWLVLVFWFGSLVMSLYCVIIAFHLGIVLGAYDISSNRDEGIIGLLKHRDKNEPRWRSQWILQMPIALFSWGVIFYLGGLALMVCEPLWKEGWGRGSWVCAIRFSLTVICYSHGRS